MLEKGNNWDHTLGVRNTMKYPSSNASQRLILRFFNCMVIHPVACLRFNSREYTRSFLYSDRYSKI